VRWMKRFVGHFNLVITSSLLMMVFSCRIGPSYKQPRVIDDSWTWKNQVIDDSAFTRTDNLTLASRPVSQDTLLKIDADWWRIFADDTLNMLIEKGVCRKSFYQHGCLPDFGIEGIGQHRARQLLPRHFCRSQHQPQQTFRKSPQSVWYHQSPAINAYYDIRSSGYEL